MERDLPEHSSPSPCFLLLGHQIIGNSFFPFFSAHIFTFIAVASLVFFKGNKVTGLSMSQAKTYYNTHEEKQLGRR